MTLAACPPESLSDDYIKYLGASTNYTIQDGNLYIDLAEGAGKMEFIPADTTQAANIQKALEAEPITGTVNTWGW